MQLYSNHAEAGNDKPDKGFHLGATAPGRWLNRSRDCVIFFTRFKQSCSQSTHQGLELHYARPQGVVDDELGNLGLKCIVTETEVSETVLSTEYWRRGRVRHPCPGS